MFFFFFKKSTMTSKQWFACVLGTSFYLKSGTPMVGQVLRCIYTGKHSTSLWDWGSGQSLPKSPLCWHCRKDDPWLLAYFVFPDPYSKSSPFISIIHAFFILYLFFDFLLILWWMQTWEFWSVLSPFLWYATISSHRVTKCKKSNWVIKRGAVK